MPKITDQCLRDVRRYVELRYDHWSEDDREKRITQTIRALKRKSKQDQDEYSQQVQEFIDKNAEFLESCERSRIESEQADWRRKKPLRNAVSQVINGYNHQQH